MKTRPNHEDATAHERVAALKLTRDLHELLLVVLVEQFGEELEVIQAPDPENGVVAYRLEAHGAVCSVGLVPFSPVAAVLSLNARLGRVSRDYPKAVRWLGRNRAFNTVALAYEEDSARVGDLWVASNRNTLSGDVEGIRYEIRDFCIEVLKAMSGLNLWFPQFFEGTALECFEKNDGPDERFRHAVGEPRVAFQILESAPEIREASPVLFSYVTRWLGKWERNLQTLESESMREWAAESEELRAKLPGARVRALMALGRYRQAMEEAIPAVPETEMAASRRVALTGQCLCELDQPEEALETLRSADWDGDPWAHFVRSFACMKLGRQEEAAAHFAEYEARIGADMMARKKLGTLVKEEDEEGS